MFGLLNRPSVRNRIRGIVLLFVVGTIFSGVFEVSSLKTSLHREKEDAIRQLVESGHSVLLYYQTLERNGSLNREAAQAAAIDALRMMRYNGQEYFWLNDEQHPARIVMHPILPELDGRPLQGDKFDCVTSLRSGTDGSFVTTNGKMNLMDAVTSVVTRTGDGYVTYNWPRVQSDGTTSSATFPKLSYVKKFAPWGWIIGSGIYIDDIDAVVQAQLAHQMLVLLGASTVLLLLAGLIARSITQPLKTTMMAMHDITWGNAGLDQRLKVVGHSEIAELARNFNEMLAHIEQRDLALLAHQEGLELEVAQRTSSLRDANLKLDAELAERKRIEKVIAESRNRMHALLDATDESVLLLARDGTILEINRFAAQHFGQTPRDMVRSDFFSHLPGDLAATRKTMLKAAVESGEIIRFQDQRDSIHFDNYLYPVKDDSGAIESVAIYAKDVTEQRRVKIDEELFLQLGTVLMRWGFDSANIAQTYCDGILPVFDLDAACIVQKRGDKLAMIAAAGGITAATIEHMDSDSSATNECLPFAAAVASDTQQLVHLSELRCERCERTFQALDLREAILLPLILHGEPWGTLALFAKEGNRFNNGLLQQRLTASANRLVIVLESALRQERLTLFDKALAEVGSAVMITDAKTNILWANQSFSLLSGYTVDEVLGRPATMFTSDTNDEALFNNFRQTVEPGLTWRGDIVNRRKDGKLYTANQLITPLLNSEREITHYVAVIEDISERKRQEKELKQNYAHLQALNEQLAYTQIQLLQAEKMASIGQLAAGVAHEINNPIGFVSSNLGTLKGYVEEMLGIIDAYSKVDALLISHPELNAEIVARKRAADLDFMKSDIGSLVSESRDGIERVKNIVQNLKDFSRIDSPDWAQANLEQGLDSTLNIVWNEVKNKADVVREYGGIPEIECLSSQLNQVFMNLLLNAAQAIVAHGTITIRTGSSGDSVWIEIEDNGPGIPPEIQNRIFDPFFTTKAVGQGTGLGLSLAYSIVQKHHGKLEVNSTLGHGSRFRVELPCRQPIQENACSATTEQVLDTNLLE